MKRYQHSNQVRSDRLCPGDNFNSGVSTLKHFTEILDADAKEHVMGFKSTIEEVLQTSLNFSAFQSKC